MDRTERYRVIVRRLIEEYASYTPSHGRIEVEAVVDRERDHYEVMHVGWDGVRRVHGCVVHIDIRGGKVWVQEPDTCVSWTMPTAASAAVGMADFVGTPAELAQQLISWAAQRRQQSQAAALV